MQEKKIERLAASITVFPVQVIFSKWLTQHCDKHFYKVVKRSSSAFLKLTCKPFLLALVNKRETKNPMKNTKRFEF